MATETTYGIMVAGDPSCRICVVRRRQRGTSAQVRQPKGVCGLPRAFRTGDLLTTWCAIDAGPESLIEALRDTPKLPVGGQWATFLRNHDEIDLS
ncbi:hypothetical protein, partial [Micromonospora sp. NPDC050695]|uniref:hypothetical protein n=1 Tax=Micromonospora sp. NPDC050695 TaxID=3154938 RepID=UPI003402CCBE